MLGISACLLRMSICITVYSLCAVYTVFLSGITWQLIDFDIWIRFIECASPEEDGSSLQPCDCHLAFYICKAAVAEHVHVQLWLQYLPVLPGNVPLHDLALPTQTKHLPKASEHVVYPEQLCCSEVCAWP